MDMPKYLGDVRCWVSSGKHLLSLSFSGFDPKQTSKGVQGMSFAASEFGKIKRNGPSRGLGAGAD